VDAIAAKEPEMEVFGFAVLVLGLIGASMLRRHLRESKQLRLRQIIHEERLKAMEHSTALPEVDDTALIGQLLGSLDPASSSEGRGLALAILWVRLVALCIGLASFFGGVATAAGMYLVNDPEFSNYWAMGLIPTLIGLGLLLFYAMSRSLRPQAAEKV
jgi:hypothetical protein